MSLPESWIQPLNHGDKIVLYVRLGRDRWFTVSADGRLWVFKSVSDQLAVEVAHTLREYEGSDRWWIRL